MEKCVLGNENKARIDNICSLVDEHKIDLKDSIRDIKDTVKDLSNMVTRIALSVFVSVLAILVNIILTFWIN